MNEITVNTNDICMPSVIVTGYPNIGSTKILDKNPTVIPIKMFVMASIMEPFLVCDIAFFSLIYQKFQTAKRTPSSVGGVH